MERSGIVGWITERLHDPRQPHLVCYPLADLLRTLLVRFAQGWRDQDDADALRLDPTLRLAVAGARGTTPLAEGAHLASQPTLSRLLDILTLEANRPVLREALAELAAQLAAGRLRAERGGRRLRHLTIDIDGLPVEAHGAQPGSAWNGHYQQSTTGSACTTRSSPARRRPATCSMPGCAPATRTPPRARSTSSSTWSTGSKARCARSPWSAWTPASPRRDCSLALKPAAHPTSRDYVTTRRWIAWPPRGSGGRQDGHRRSRACGSMRWTIGLGRGRAPAASCWSCGSAPTTCCSTTSGCSPASPPAPCRPRRCSPITASAAPPRATSAN